MIVQKVVKYGPTGAKVGEEHHEITDEGVWWQAYLTIMTKAAMTAIQHPDQYAREAANTMVTVVRAKRLGRLPSDAPSTDDVMPDGFECAHCHASFPLDRIGGMAGPKAICGPCTREREINSSKGHRP